MDETIRRLEAGDRAAAARLLDDAVGAGFWGFCSGAGDVSAVALAGGRLTGAVIAHLEPVARDAERAFGPAGDAWAGGAAAGVRRRRSVLHVRAVAVAPEARRRGLGTRLLAHAENAAVALGAQTAYLFAWLPAGRPEPGAVRLYAAAGYAPGRDLADFYAAGSLASGATCPFCGAPPCRCAARPYAKPLAAG
jgi:GNAT superfamily N-acetyltransferase